MKSFTRYMALIAVTALVTLAAVHWISPSSSSAQPAGQPAAQPPPVVQPEKAKDQPDKPAESPNPAANQSTQETNPGGPARGGQAAPAAGAGAAPAAPAGKQWFDELEERPIDEDGNFWMPKAVNSVADDSDRMYYAVYALSVFFTIAIFGAVIFFCIKYRHRPGHKAQPSASHNDALEITWTVIPTIITVFLFYYGWRTYVRVVTPPQKALEIRLEAFKWGWDFTHFNGVKDRDLHVPIDTPIRIVMTSRDVLHAFYAPVMRVKQDIIPRRYTYVWFHPTKPGTYRLTCAEYCGTDHSQMGVDTKTGRRAVVVVHTPGQYEKYLNDMKALSESGPPEEIGERVYNMKGCASCHSIDGTTKIGPTFKGTFGTKQKMADGSSVTVDDNYIRQSLMAPNAKIRAGFPPGTMPSFEGTLSQKEIEGVIAFIKTLK